ncbi:hypothetical protein M098_0985 [Phocaeicola vulgatus str. 3775 SR(B) 19]|nr:hypothetical protein M098_0985 [Phocaeicola vulgatus str. 3775 SR(B) 19]
MIRDTFETFLSCSMVCLSISCRTASRSESFIFTLVESMVLDRLMSRVLLSMTRSRLDVSVCRVDVPSFLFVTRSMHFSDSLPCLSMIDLAVSQLEMTELTLRIMSSVSSSRSFCSFR